MTKIHLTLACEPYDRVRGLMDGTVQVDGCDLTILPLSAEEIFHRAFGHQEFEISELSLSSYMLSVERGNCPYVGIPVFISRAFRQSAIYIRKDRQIENPSDLRGRIVGVPEYQMTAALWARGMLSDVYGVKSHEIRWRTGGLEDPGREEKIPLSLPPHFEVKKISADETLNAMLKAGELDAIISARAPTCLGEADSCAARLFLDIRRAEEDYFRKTRIFPIMHLVGIRRDIADRFAWLPASVLKAFVQAKAQCMAKFGEVGTLAATLPFLNSEFDATKALMGDDYWPYGIEENRKTLEAATRYSHEQGLMTRVLAVDELFFLGHKRALQDMRRGPTAMRIVKSNRENFRE